MALAAATDERPWGNIPLWERLFVVLTLVTACRAFDTFLSTVGEHPSGGYVEMNESSPLRFAWLALLYGISLALLVYHHRADLLRLASQNKLLIAAIGYIFCSTFWAFDNTASLRRATAFALTATFCAYLALRYKPIQLLKLACWALLVVAVASVFAVALFPGFSVEEYGRKLGSWKGVSCINTAFGRFMALGVLVTWSLRRVDWGLRNVDVLVLLLFLVCLFNADAATSILAVFAGFTSILMIWSRSVFNIDLPAKTLVGVMFGAIAVMTVPLYFEEVLDLVGRDATLTNRIFIWGAAFEQGWQNPVFGVGYESFWIAGNAAQAFYNMFGSADTQLGNGHNGYLDAWLELGFVGLAFVLALLAQGFSRVIKVLTRTDSPFAEFYGGLLVFILIYSIAEKVIFVHSELTWMLFMSGLMSLRWHFDPSAVRDETAPNWGGALPQPQRMP